MKWKELPKNIKVRMITSFFNRAVSSAVMPFMALFFAQEMSKVWAGAFLIITVIIGFFINLVGGYISDRFPRKKVLLSTSWLISLFFLLMTISLFPKENLIWLFAFAYIGFIVSSSLGRPAMNAIIIDSTTAENRKAVYALDYWLINLSLAIGSALGGLLYIHHKQELFMMLTLTSTIIPIAYWLFLEDKFQNQLKKKHQNVLIDLVNNYKVAFKDTAFVKVVIGTTFILAAEFSMNSYIGIRLSETFKSIQLGDFEISGVRMLSILNIQNMLLVVCFTFLVNRISDKFNKKHALLTGLILYLVGYATITSANTWYILIVFSIIATIGELIYSPIRNTEQANMIPSDKRGSYSAFANLSYSGADLVARSTIILGAFLIPSMMSVYIGIIIALGTILVYGGLFIQDRKSVKEKNKSVIQVNGGD